MDSGAFSVWKSGKTIDLNAYIRFVSKHLPKITTYAVLDVIGSPIGSFDNYIKMREAGLNPIPCYHCGEPLHWLDQYIELGCTYIGLGGMAKIDKHSRRQFFHDVFRKYPDSTKIKFHGFGVSDIQLCLEFPFYSCDSTTAMLTGAQGIIMTPFGKFSTSTERANNISDLKLQKFHEWVLSVGGDLGRAYLRGGPGAYERAWISIQAIKQMLEPAPTVYKPIQGGFIL